MLSYTGQQVVSRAIEIWGDGMMRVMEEFESLAQSKRQKKQSCETLLHQYKDPSVVIRFQFFQDLANMLEVFKIFK